MPTEGPFAPGTLAAMAERATHRALASGALQSIETESELIEDAGVRFVLRTASNLARKDRALAQQGAEDPLAEPHPDLFVARVSESHVALLNKFNLLDRHLLIVTLRFEHQERLLSEADFGALARCMAELDGLGIYNGGAEAGASQLHKHLQFVPLPLDPAIAPGEPGVPMEALFDAAEPGNGALQVPGLPFGHAFVRVGPPLWATTERAARTLHGLYRVMLRAVAIEPLGADARHSSAYNLLCTRRWMLLVPRSRERFESISVNAFGFAGSLFVRTREQASRVREHGPMAVLRAVGVARRAPPDAPSGES